MKLVTTALCALILWIFQGILYHRFWARALSVRLSFDRPSAVEGDHALLKEVIINAKTLPIPIVHVKFSMGKYLVFTSSQNFKITDHNYRSDIFSCMPWQETRRSLEFVCRRRGYYTIPEIQLVSYDLFFSSHLVASLSSDACLYVYPRAIESERLLLPLRSLMGQILADRSLIFDPFETQSVRPYQSYDPYRSVNWKATARTGELKVNVYAPTASWQVMFLLDMKSDRIWKDEDLAEESLRLCGSYSRLLIEEGIPVSVRTNGIDCLTNCPGSLESGAGRDHIRAVMELLARIETDDKAVAIEQILEELSCASHGSPSWGDHLIYILISPGQRSSMIRAYERLCRGCPGSQWILPLRPDQRPQAAAGNLFTLFPWEVPYDYSQTS